MSASALTERTVGQELGEFVVAVSFAGTTAGFALGDGTVRLTDGGAWRTIEVHDGPVLAMARAGTGWVTSGDDGGFRRVTAGGEVSEVARFKGKWVEQVAAFDDGKAPLVACAVGKAVHVFDGRGERVKSFEHPSSVTGVTFDAKGKRVAASHYNGCSLWFVNAKADTPRVLEWKGSHTGIAMHPGGDAVVTCMQENALHGWRLADGQHMRMSGYPSKTESLSFSRNGKWLASAGADTVVLWPFFGGGPMGKAPLELAGGDGVLCTRVAFNPQQSGGQQDIVAAGFTDGLVVIADVASERILPVSLPKTWDRSGDGAGVVGRWQQAGVWNRDGVCRAR